MTQPAVCKPLGDHIGEYGLYGETTTTCSNEHEVAEQGVRFYGKGQQSGNPIWAVMPYTTFKNAKTGMIVASALGAVFLVSTAVLAVQLHKRR